MKAIKLASVFAVSAVAAAVSTTTFAAEPVFTGSAGLEYKATDADGGDAAGSNGEVNIIGDTGLVYFDLDMDTGNGNFVLDEAFVKQGAVSFGDFDGSLADGAAYSAGVREDNDGAKKTLGTDLGIRYSVMPGLTVAAEMAEGSSQSSVAASYSQDLGVATLGLSGAFGFGTDADNQIMTAGVSVPAGMATVTGFYQTGKASDADVTSYGLGLDLALTEAVSAAAQYYVDDEADKGGVTEGSLYYTAGDIVYYVSYVDYENDTSDYSVIGAEASF
ncbi:hypothetical protein ACFQ45_14965 [Rhodanobacter aciditrophus]|uniref:Porin n=1 Tax=Rhodanobacter aciditrophus TaxID=1623218 RepID=A0ABW4B3N7_9GAMM